MYTFVRQERYDRRRLEVLGDSSSQEGGSSHEDSKPSENAIFLEVVGGRKKKGNVFGLGKMSEYFVKETQGTHSSSQFNNNASFQQLQQTIRAQDDEISEMRTAIRTRDTQISQLAGALQSVMVRLGMSMPPITIPAIDSPPHITDDSATHPDQHARDDGSAPDHAADHISHPPSST